jgi:antitoxin ParD1/3/4
MASTIHLDEQAQHFVAEQVASGRYKNSNEVVQAGLRLLKARDEQFNELKRLIDEGIESGGDEPLDLEIIFAEVEAEHKGR